MEKFLKPQLIDLPKIYDPRGNLTFMQDGQDCMPFPIKRVFWTYDVPAGEGRGGHAHYTCHELIVAVSGSFNANLFDGREWTHYTLNRPYIGLLLPAGYWRTLDNFASGSVCVALASDIYKEEDYIRDFEEFVKYSQKRHG